jgi:small basic protein
MIDPIFENKGYVDVVNFFNKQMSNPTQGAHNSVVADLVDRLPVGDYYGYAQELYHDKFNYSAVVFISPSEEIIYIEDGNPIAINMWDGGSLFAMMNTGLKEFYSGVIPLYGLNNNNIVAHLQVYMSDEYGCDMYYTYILDDGIVIKQGIIMAQAVEDQRLGNYVVKIDKTSYDIIEMKAGRNQYTQFQVQVSDEVYENFSYRKLGQVMYVQDTAIARKQIQSLVRKGVVHANV